MEEATENIAWDASLLDALEEVWMPLNKGVILAKSCRLRAQFREGGDLLLHAWDMIPR